MLKAIDPDDGCGGAQIWACAHPLKEPLSCYDDLEEEPGRLLRGGCVDQSAGEPVIVELKQKDVEDLKLVREIHGEWSPQLHSRTVNLVNNDYLKIIDAEFVDVTRELVEA